MYHFKKSIVFVLILLLSFTSSTVLFASVKAETWIDITLPYIITESGNYRLISAWNGNGIGLSINASNVVVDGQNFLIQLTQSDGNYGVVIAPGSINLLLENINETSAGYGVYSEEGNFTVKDSMFTNNTSSGVFASNVTDFSILHSRVSNNTYGLVTVNSSNFSVKNCNINNDTTGIKAVLGSDFALMDSNLDNNTMAFMIRNCTDFTISDSTFQNNDNSLDSKSSNFVINNSSFTNNSLLAIYSLYSNFTFSNSSLSYNDIGLEAIYNTLTVSNATLNNNVMGMAALESNFTLQDSSVNNNTFFGILLSSGNFIVNNSSISNNTIGLYSEVSDSFTLENSRIYNNNLGLIDTYGNSTIIKGNNFSENRLGTDFETGALMVEDSNCTVINNVFVNNLNSLIIPAYDEELNNSQVYQNNAFMNNNFTFNFSYELSNNYTNQQFFFFNNLVNDTTYINPESFGDSHLYLPPETVFHLNATIQSGIRVYSMGSKIGGNYWAHPDGSGYSQTATDANNDGFIDAPFDFFSNVTSNMTIYDYLPYSSGDIANLFFFAGAGQELAANQTSQPITVGIKDSLGNITSGANITLSSTSSTGKFYSDISRSRQISSIIITAGQISGAFYYEDIAAGTPNITVCSANVTSVSSQLIINPVAVDHFAVTIPSAQRYGNSVCIMIRAQDAFENTVTGFAGSVSLSSSLGAISPSSCSLVGGVWVGHVTLLSGTATVTAEDDSGHFGTSTTVVTEALSITHTPSPNNSSSPETTVLPTPTKSPSPTTTPSSTTIPTSTSTATLATFGQYITVMAAIIILGAVIIGVMQRRKLSTKAPLT